MIGTSGAGGALATGLLGRQTLALGRLAAAADAWAKLQDVESILRQALAEALAVSGAVFGLALLEDGAPGVWRPLAVDGPLDPPSDPLFSGEVQGLLGAFAEPGLPPIPLQDRPHLAACFPGSPSVHCVPLLVRGRPRAVLLLRFKGTPQDEAALDLMRVLAPHLAGHASAAMRGADLFRRLVDRTRELERTVDELGRSQRRAELVQLSAAVAHQIRNPLSVVAAHVDLMREGAGADGGRMEILDLLAKKVGEANATVQQLLELSRPLLLRLRPVPLGPLTQSFVRFIEPKCRLQGVTLECSIEEGLPMVRAEENSLQRCLLDLCLNALQVLPGSGRLRISARRSGAMVALAVQDDGPGIGDAMLPLLFEPFVSGRTGGTGMGLFNVRRICREMGATVMAGNLVDGGSRFCLNLRTVPSGGGLEAEGLEAQA